MIRTAHRPTRMAPQITESGEPWPDPQLAVRTQAEVAEIITANGYPMSASRVGQLERRAMDKLASSKIMRRLFKEIGG